jgi:hypothetical protein
MKAIERICERDAGLYRSPIVLEYYYCAEVGDGAENEEGVGDRLDLSRTRRR